MKVADLKMRKALQQLLLPGFDFRVIFGYSLLVIEKIKNPREWAQGTTDRRGRERDLEDYEHWLGIQREELREKKILDIGSGETEMFSRDLLTENIDAKVFSLNPDYSFKRFRGKIKKVKGWTEKSVAGTAQELPFLDTPTGIG